MVYRCVSPGWLGGWSVTTRKKRAPGGGVRGRKPACKSNSVPEKKAKFTAALAQSGVVLYAAREAAIDTQTAYRWRKADDDFREAWETALNESVDRLETEARRRALDGVLEPVYYQGVEVGHQTRYSDTLLIFLLKGARPAKYRDNARVEHSGPGGGPIVTARAEELSDDELAAIVASAVEGQA